MEESEEFKLALIESIGWRGIPLVIGIDPPILFDKWPHPHVEPRVDTTTKQSQDQVPGGNGPPRQRGAIHVDRISSLSNAVAVKWARTGRCGARELGSVSAIGCGGVWPWTT